MPKAGKKPKPDDVSNLYENICVRYGICPQKFAKMFLKEGILNVRADRLKSDDWVPILEILEDSSHIRCVRIANARKEVAVKTASNRKKCEIANLCAGEIRRETLTKICQSLKRVLTKSSGALECLILDNVCLQTEYVKILCDVCMRAWTKKSFWATVCQLCELTFKLSSK